MYIEEKDRYPVCFQYYDRYSKYWIPFTVYIVSLKNDLRAYLRGRAFRYFHILLFPIPIIWLHSFLFVLRFQESFTSQLCFIELSKPIEMLVYVTDVSVTAAWGLRLSSHACRAANQFRFECEARKTSSQQAPRQVYTVELHCWSAGLKIILVLFNF